VPFVSIIHGGNHLSELFERLNHEPIHVALVKLDRFTDLEKEQVALQEKNVAKLLITSAF
ncbi:MAG: hypothetical protein LOD89_01965, partial [Tissierellales bacterium]